MKSRRATTPDTKWKASRQLSVALKNYFISRSVSLTRKSSVFCNLETKLLFYNVWLFFKFLVGWDWVHLARRPLFGLLYQPRMLDGECEAVGGMKIGMGIRLGETLPKFPFSTTNSTWPDLTSNAGRRGGKPAANRLSHGTGMIRVEC
jgi:hypothetical protein